MSSNVLHLVGDNVNVGQVGATFYGPRVCQVYSDSTLVTIICQGRCYNILGEYQGVIHLL